MLLPPGAQLHSSRAAPTSLTPLLPSSVSGRPKLQYLQLWRIVTVEKSVVTVPGVLGLPALLGRFRSSSCGVSCCSESQERAGTAYFSQIRVHWGTGNGQTRSYFGSGR